jgi:hypothetical protein
MTLYALGACTRFWVYNLLGNKNVTNGSCKEKLNTSFMSVTLPPYVLQFWRMLKSRRDLMLWKPGLQGGVVAQAVSGWRPGFAPGQVMWDLWWTKWHWGRFSTSTSVSSASHYSTKFFILIITQGRCNRPIGGRHAEWTQLHSTATTRIKKKRFAVKQKKFLPSFS